MSRHWLRRPAHGDRGASTVIVALLLPVLLGAAALAIDLSMLTLQRQNLTNALDSAAQAAAYSLPSDPTGARNVALAFAAANDPEANPTVTFWCIVASTGSTKTVRSGEIPGTCNPGTISGARCNTSICAIPCTAGSGHTCNAINVQDDKDVAFSFAPAIGINNGNTGSVSSTACKGSCGAAPPNPMDVVVVADRTGSMSAADRDLMVSAIKSTLQTMTKEQQYVALGTIHRSSPTAACVTAPSASATTGSWVPVPFSNDYILAAANPGQTPALNTNSTLIKGLNCLGSSSGGTYLASPLKAAARYVLGLSSNNLSTLPTRPTVARKAIIFETDGEPNEANITGSTDLDTTTDIGTTNGATACTNFAQVATNAKARGILSITVAFGSATTARCTTSGTFVRTVLAAAASPDALGQASDADNDCSTPALRTTENADGDFFYCAATGSELGSIFVSAINQLNSRTRLLSLPK
jgi:Flp pilus assembly protein TadG